MILEHIIIARHGDAFGTLTEKGVAQVQRLGSCIKQIVSTPALIAASPELRAQETARIIADLLSVKKVNLYAWLEGGPVEEVNALLDKPGKKTKTLILVTHAPESMELPYVISSKLFGHKAGFIDLDKGTAYHLAIEARVWTELPSGRMRYDMKGESQ